MLFHVWVSGARAELGPRALLAHHNVVHWFACQLSGRKPLPGTLWALLPTPCWPIFYFGCHCCSCCFTRPGTAAWCCCCCCCSLQCHDMSTFNTCSIRLPDPSQFSLLFWELFLFSSFVWATKICHLSKMLSKAHYIFSDRGERNSPKMRSIVKLYLNAWVT